MPRAADIVIPRGGGPHEKLRLAPNDLVEAQRPFVEEFWSEVFGTSYSTSFASNADPLYSWEQYVGGRAELIARVQDVYGVDITDVYDRPKHEVLAYVRTRTKRSRCPRSLAETVRLSGFENDGGLRVLLARLGLYDDYKVILPRNLTDILREQFPETVVDAIELRDEPDCEVDGIVGEDGALAVVQRVTAVLPLRATVHVDRSRYLLDIQLTMRIEDVDAWRRTTFDFDVDRQVPEPPRIVRLVRRGTVHLGKLLLGVLGLASPLVLAFLGAAFFFAQRADYGWNPGIAAPHFASDHPRVLVDEAHHNASKVGFTDRYWPFGRLLRADGYAVERGKHAITPEQLEGVRVLVIANPAGAPKPQLFGINLPVRTDRKRSDPAFAAGEIETIRSWVEQGGSLLLIADHAPFGESAEALGRAFGVTMHKGFVEVPDEISDPLLFSTANGRLGEHAILSGAGPGKAPTRVATYTGQSLDAPAGATVLLRLPETAIEAVPEGDSLAVRPAGPAQALAFERGKGRVVVLGEAGMATAQAYRRERYGMSAPDNDNRQFVLNVMRWLARAP